MVTQGYEPKNVLRFFEEISAIPRGSSNEKAVSDYLVNFAHNYGLYCYRDDIYNVFIKKPATLGYETKPVIMLQGHTDMVCEKNSDTIHDFEKDGIDLYVKDGWLHANGTTLGADNGVAVALMLAVLEDGSISHPAIECLFTVQEETGLVGAATFDTSRSKADMLINLDGGGEGEAMVSCAGGHTNILTRKIEWENCNDKKYLKIKITGLLGGHSGGDIDKGMGNSNKIMARMLSNISDKQDIQIHSIHGGSKDNAIPRECECIIAVCDIEKVKDEALKITNDVSFEMGINGENLKINVENTEPVPVWSAKMTDDVINMLLIAPSGVMSKDIDKNFVLSSVNMGVVVTDNESLCITFSARSSVESLQEETISKIKAIAKIFDFSITSKGKYPGWTYEEKSEIRNMVAAAYTKLFNIELVCNNIHAGLECGLLKGKMPNLDIIAMGPTSVKCHTPDEALNLASLDRFWSLLKCVLENA